MNRLLLVLALLAPLSAAAQFAAEVSAPFTNRYVFRGVELAGDSLQPSVELTFGNLTASVWTNRPLSKADDPAREWDCGLSYSLEREVINTEVGLLAYHYPRLDTSDGAKRTTYEPALTLSRDVGPCAIATTAFYDWTLKTATYQVSLSSEHAIGTSLTVTPEVSTGWVRPRGAAEDNPAYRYWSAGVELSYALTPKVAATLAGGYTSSSLIDAKRDLWTYTVGLRAAF